MGLVGLGFRVWGGVVRVVVLTPAVESADIKIETVLQQCSAEVIRARAKFSPL